MLRSMHRAVSEEFGPLEDYWNVARDLAARLDALASSLRGTGAVGPSGQWRCEKCGFTEQRITVSVLDGGSRATALVDADSLICPNDGQPLRGITWEEAYIAREEGARFSKQRMLELITENDALRTTALSCTPPVRHAEQEVLCWQVRDANGVLMSRNDPDDPLTEGEAHQLANDYNDPTCEQSYARPVRVLALVERASSSSDRGGTGEPDDRVCECGHGPEYHVCTANHDGMCPCCEFAPDRDAPSLAQRVQDEAVRICLARSLSLLEDGPEPHFAESNEARKCAGAVGLNTARLTHYRPDALRIEQELHAARLSAKPTPESPTPDVKP